MIIKPSKPGSFRRLIRNLRKHRHLSQGGFLVHTHRDGGIIGALNHGSSVPLPTTDANLWAWFRSDLGVTKDGSDRLTSTGGWADQSGNARNLVGQDTEYSTWLSSQVNGHPAISFDGTAHSRLTHPGGTTGLTQPYSLYFLIYIPAYMADAYICDGSGGNDGAVIMRDGSPHIQTYAGNLGPEVSVSFASWFILTEIFDGASSVAQVNNTTEATGNAGSTSAARIALGAYSGGSFDYSTFKLGAMIASLGHNDSTTRNIHKNWLAYYAGLSI